MKEMQVYFDRGVVHPGHPPVIMMGQMKAETKALKAGTVLALADGVYSAVGSSGTPAAVLLEDVEGHTEVVTAEIIRHGMVVRSRLLDYSTAAEKLAEDALVNKLSATGLYPVQGGWSESNFR